MPLGNEATPHASPSTDVSIPIAPIDGPPHSAVTAEMLTEDFRKLDLVLAFLVMVLAVFVASFASRTSDLWMHLGSGRLLATGNYTFGVDPFCFTTEGVYWTNNAWLSELGLHYLAGAFGGADTEIGGRALIIAKAILVVIAAWIMMLTRRPYASRWSSAFFVAAALVAISPRLILQPTIISCLLLAITMWILYSGTLTRKHGRFWLLVPLFGLWANLDFWFLAGPVAAALWALGSMLEDLGKPSGDKSGLWPTLFLAIAGGLVACMLNPHHIHVFRLPPTLTLESGREVLAQDNYLSAYFWGFADDAYWRAGSSYTVATLMQPVLLIAGALSFVLAFWKSAPWTRLFVWLAFAVLSIYQVRGVGLFCIVAGPITAINMQGFGHALLWSRTELDRSWKAFFAGGRLLTFLLLLAALAYGWPGWLHAAARDTRQAHRVSWRVLVEPSLKKPMQQLGRWREQGLLAKGARCFHYVPETANYADYFSGLDAEKGFVDFRFSLFDREVASDYVDLRRGLREYGMSANNPDATPVDWAAIMRKYQMHYVVLHTADPTAIRVWATLLRDWSNWHLVYMDGRASVFRWMDPQWQEAEANAQRLPRLSVEAQAFMEPPAHVPPARGPGRGPLEPDPWTSYAMGAKPQPLDTELSNYYQDYYTLISNSWLPPYLIAVNGISWSTVVASLPAAPGAGTILGPFNLLWNNWPILSVMAGRAAPDAVMQFRDFDTGPIAALFLAVRAGRIAAAENPDDGKTYISLGSAYDTLWRISEEPGGPRTSQVDQMTPRQRVRMAQVLTALEFGLRMQPSQVDIHLKLSEIYMNLSNVDMAEEHVIEAIRYMRIAGPLPNEEPREYREKLERLENNFKRLRDDLKTRRDAYELDAANQTVFNKAQAALSRGLGKKALELLLQLDLPSVSPQELQIILELHLQMGKADIVLDVLKPEMKALLRPEVYSDLRIRAAAAMGEYAETARLIDEEIAKLRDAIRMDTIVQLKRQMFQGMPLDVLATGNRLAGMYRVLAEWRVLRGVQAIESGDIDAARRNLAESLALSTDKTFQFESKGVAVRYLSHLNAKGTGAN